MITLRIFGNSDNSSLNSMTLTLLQSMVTGCLFTVMKVPNKKHSLSKERTFVEENYMLFRDRVTVFTQVSSEKNIILDPEFVFKGKGTRTKAAVADRVNYQ